MSAANRKPAIGSAPLGDYYTILTKVIANIDMLTGRVTGELPLLASTATTADIIAAINAIVTRLNASTN